MRLRIIGLILALGILAAPLAGEAQPAGKVWRIGLFHVGLDHVPPSLDGLRKGLKALGYDSGTLPAPKVSTVMEGKNIRLDWRNLADEEAARETAKEFVRDRVDLIVAFEDQCVRAAMAATPEIPVLFLHVADPVAMGYVKSFAHPGGNLTGFAGLAPELLTKRMEIFKEINPRLGRLLVLRIPNDPGVELDLPSVRRAGATLKIKLVEREVRDQADIEGIFRGLKGGEVHGVLALGSVQTNFTALIVRLASENHLPLAAHRREWARQGALFSYAYDFRSTGSDAARYVDKILKGAKPANLPVEQVSRFELVINLKTAKALGLTFPRSVLIRADQVIE